MSALPSGSLTIWLCEGNSLIGVDTLRFLLQLDSLRKWVFISALTMLISVR